MLLASPLLQVVIKSVACSIGQHQLKKLLKAIIPTLIAKKVLQTLYQKPKRILSHKLEKTPWHVSKLHSKLRKSKTNCPLNQIQ